MCRLGLSNQQPQLHSPSSPSILPTAGLGRHASLRRSSVKLDPGGKVEQGRGALVAVRMATPPSAPDPTMSVMLRWISFD